MAALVQPSSSEGGTGDDDPLPIFDMHFHAQRGWDVDGLPALWDDLNVVGAAQGARGQETLATTLAERLPGRFFPFGGSAVLSELLCDGEKQAGDSSGKPSLTTWLS